MNPEIKKLWIEALTSGEYEQGQGSLCAKTKDGKYQFCCLGVLSELAYKQGIIQKREYNETYQYVNPHDDLDVSHLLLIEPVVQWAGLENYNPTVQEVSLSDWNDDGETFEEIAKLIERNL